MPSCTLGVFSVGTVRCTRRPTPKCRPYFTPHLLCSGLAPCASCTQQGATTASVSLAGVGAAGGELGEAEQLLAGLPERGLRADLVSYNCVISAAEKAGNWERALALFDQLRERIGDLEETSSHMKLHEAT